MEVCGRAAGSGTTIPPQLGGFNVADHISHSVVRLQLNHTLSPGFQLMLILS